MGIELIEIAAWHSAEDSDKQGREQESTDECLNEDGVLNLSKSWLGDPDFAVEDFADDVTLLVSGDPRFIFEGVGDGADECILRHQLLVQHIIRLVGE